MKKDTQFKELLQLISSHESTIEEFKANKKRNNALILELEMMLSNEKELNAKNMELLTEEEKKSQANK